MINYSQQKKLAITSAETSLGELEKFDSYGEPLSSFNKKRNIMNRCCGVERAEENGVQLKNQLILLHNRVSLTWFRFL